MSMVSFLRYNDGATGPGAAIHNNSLQALSPGAARQDHPPPSSLAGSRGAGEYSLGPVSVEPHGRSPARSAPAFLPEESVPLPKLPRHQNTRMSESSLLFTSW